MVAVRAGAAFVLGAMTAAVLAGFASGSFTMEGEVLLALTWGRVTLIDAYLAFAVGWGIIALREAHAGRAAAWAVAVATTGSLALGVYVLGAAVRSGDDVDRLLLGPTRR